MATAHIIVSLLFVFFISCYFAQTPTGDKSTPNPCTSKLNCSACITSSNLCAWCEQKDYTQNDLLLPRCDLFAQLILKGCDISSIVDPRSEANFIKNDSLSNVGEADAVQIKPQEIILKLRPNEPFTLQVDFRQAEDYPVDLYYLMDLSNSMEDDKAKLAELGGLLATRMSNITKDFQLGFGSFVDKVVMPFVSTVPAKLIKPCDQRDGTACAKPYGFHNHMPLDLNTSRFSTEVSDAKVSGNLDAPEGGFDAIMQAIACQNEIRWRNQSRKLLVFSTDAGFHHAGDGKLGGIVKPNDGNCHLNNEGYYIESNSMDYPSLSQINQKILDHKINTIFAVTADQLPIYERLSEHIDGAISAHLENDSSNIVELIKDQYEKISSKVELNVNATSSVKVTMVSNCLGNTTEKTNVCQGLKVGSTVSFNVTFSVETCPKDPKELNQIVQIDPIGIKEQLLVRLEILCECDCEKPQNEVVDSDYCFNGNGTYECGICSCYKNRFGQFCECGSDDVNREDYKANCTVPNTSSICSGRGRCECGRCKCILDSPFGEIWGQYCECDNVDCPRSGNKLCGGRGQCSCNKCICDKGYSGEDCSCSTSNATCIASNGKLCNDKGECVCGNCICNDTGPERYSGPHCDKCPICANKCEMYKECVQCFVFKSGPKPLKNCTVEICGFQPVEVDELDEKNEDITICKDRDDDDCTFRFSYFVNETKLYIEVEKTKSCPEAVPILPIILGVIGGIVAIGLALLLIWKLLTTIHDRREFAKFEKERQNAKWDTGENPIYKQATSTFKNPTYGGK